MLVDCFAHFEVTLRPSILLRILSLYVRIPTVRLKSSNYSYVKLRAKNICYLTIEKASSLFTNGEAVDFLMLLLLIAITMATVVRSVITHNKTNTTLVMASLRFS